MEMNVTLAPIKHCERERVTMYRNASEVQYVVMYILSRLEYQPTLDFARAQSHTS